MRSRFETNDQFPNHVWDAVDRAWIRKEDDALYGRYDQGKGDWPEPKSIESSLPAVASFSAELLPERIKGYVFDVADRHQAPPDFTAVTAVCGLAAIAGNKVRIRPKRNDDWEVVPNIWGAIIGRPSAMKSPSMRSALAPVYALQDFLRELWETSQHEADVEAALSALDLLDAKKQAAKALKVGDREEAKRLLAKHEITDDDVPCPRIIVNDSTVEKLGELLNQNPRGLLLVRDELPGFLARMESEEYQIERAFYLEAYNGDGQFTYDRIGRGTIHIENCTLSLIGGAQPAKIASLIRGAVTGVRDDGLVQRLQLAVWPDDIGSWEWIDRRRDAIAKEKYEGAFRSLHDFARGFERPVSLPFSADAQDLFRQWMIEVQGEARAGKRSSAFESHLLKIPKTVASLALIFELVDGGRDTVGVVSTARALDWADYLKSHATRIYSAGCVVAENGARLIVERRDQLEKPFTAREVQRKAWAGLYDRETVADALDVLVSTSHVKATLALSGEAGGRPATVYSWNPKLGEG